MVKLCDINTCLIIVLVYYMANLVLGVGQMIKYTNTFFVCFAKGGEGRVKETRTCISLGDFRSCARVYFCPLIWLSHFLPMRDSPRLIVFFSMANNQWNN